MAKGNNAQGKDKKKEKAKAAPKKDAPKKKAPPKKKDEPSLSDVRMYCRYHPHLVVPSPTDCCKIV